LEKLQSERAIGRDHFGRYTLEKPTP
jgi:hypothetical protein